MIQTQNKKHRPVITVRLVLPVFCLFVLFATACSLKPLADQAVTPESDTTAIELQAALDKWRESELITGASMSVSNSEIGQISLASGHASLTIDPERFSDDPLTIDRPMFVGDITHVLVAATIVELSKANMLRLDQTSDTWFPQIQNSNQITIRNLLEHTSGVPVFYTQEFLDDIYENQPDVARYPDQVINVAAAEGSFFDPGTKYGYSKTNFIILGRIIELVTGTPLETELRNRFLDPLDMNDTYLAGREAIPGGIPGGYEYAGPNSLAPTSLDGHVPQTPEISVISAEWASGALVSTPKDILKFVQAIFNSSQYSGVRAELTKVAAHPAQDGENRINSGAGVFVWDEDGEQVVGQFGFIYPFSAQFIYWPASKTAIAVIANEVDSSSNPNFNFQLPIIENLTSRVKEILDEGE